MDEDQFATQMKDDNAKRMQVKERLLRNKRILREEIYLKELKPFFEKGENHVKFYKETWGQTL
jgi:hypothetical protein